MLRTRHCYCLGSGCLILVASAALMLGCGKKSPPPAGGTPSTRLVMSAAASTKEVVEAIAAEFTKQNGVEVKVNVGPSNALAGQILAGAPVDLFLSANAKWADEVTKAGLANESIRLLTNHLVIVVSPGNPANLHEPNDLLSERVQKLALAGEQVPAGMYADQALAKLELMKQLVDGGKIVRGQDVRSALSYVERGEAEAGIVYSTDVGIAANIESAYQFDPALHNEIVYVLVLTKMGASNSAATKLFGFLNSSSADATYTKFGFVRLR